MNFGKNLQVLRKMTNLTQENMAEKLDVSRQTISKWEQNLACPEIEKLIEVCELFHCSVDQILREDMIVNDEAYSEIRIVTVEEFRYIQYAVISVEPEVDAISHVRSWAKQLKIDNPYIIGWDFPNISQEQRNVFHMHGYAAALVLDKEQEIRDINADIVSQEKQKYITITVKGTSEAPFVVIPNAYKALLTHMKTNGIREKRDSSVLACYEYEYVDAVGINCMDIFIAIE